MWTPTILDIATPNTQSWIAVSVAAVAAIAAALALIFAWQSADASKDSANAAKEAVDHQIRVYKENNAAKVVRHDDVDFSNNERFAWVTLRMYNEGPAVAKNLVLTFRKSLAEQLSEELDPELAPISSPKHRALQPFETALLLAEIPKYFDGTDGWAACDVTYEDGNGQHKLQYFLRVSGPWGSNWIQRIQDEDPRLGGNAE